MIEKFNLGALMKNAKKMQEMIEKSQEELAHTEVTGESGAGLVKVTMNGRNTVIKVVLSDDLMKESTEVIQDLITAAMNSATKKVAELSRSKMADMTHLFDHG